MPPPPPATSARDLSWALLGCEGERPTLTPTTGVSVEGPVGGDDDEGTVPAGGRAHQRARSGLADGTIPDMGGGGSGGGHGQARF